MPDRLRGFGLVAAAGLGAGLAVFWLTLWLSLTDVGGPGWSLRGNGALIVLFAVGPALLAAGWAWLAARSARRALAAGGVALMLALAMGFGPIFVLLLGAGGATASSILIALALGAGLLGGVLIASGQGWLPGALACLLGLVLTLVVSGIGYLLAPLFMAVVLATPIVARYWSSRLGAECALLLVSMLVGNFGGQYLFA